MRGGFGRYRDGSWLTPGLIRFASVTSLGLGTATLVALVATARGTLDAFGKPLGTDFTAFWSAGALALSGRAPDAYDWGTLRAAQAALHGSDAFFPWSYPPTFFLVAAPLAALPYLWALGLWVAATVLAALAALRAVLPGRSVLLPALGCPVALACAMHGQTAFLTAALLAGGVLCLRGRETLAGVLFGLASYKPHLGLLVPLALAAGGHWRALGGASATVLALVGLTLAIWDAEVWAAFLRSVPLTQAAVLDGGGPGFAKFQSAFAACRGWGASVPFAYAAQGAAALAAAGCCVLVWRSGADGRLKGAVLLVGTLLASPYVLDYDGVVLATGAAFLAAHGTEHGFRPWLATAVAAAWVAPAVSPAVAGAFGVPLGLGVTAWVFGLAVRESLETGRVPSVAAPGPVPA